MWVSQQNQQRPAGFSVGENCWPFCIGEFFSKPFTKLLPEYLSDDEYASDDRIAFLWSKTIVKLSGIVTSRIQAAGRYYRVKKAMIFAEQLGRDRSLSHTELCIIRLRSFLTHQARTYPSALPVLNAASL